MDEIEFDVIGSIKELSAINTAQYDLINYLYRKLFFDKD